MTVAQQITEVDFKIADQSFHALTAGDPARPLLLFLHGFPEFSGAWRDLMARLCDRYYCVAPDQRGYGKSWRPAEVAQYATKHLVADVLGFIDHFGHGKAAAVIGHDWGASVAYATAIRRPEKMATLVIANGVHPVPFQAALAAGGAQSEASQYITWLRSEGSEDALAKDNFARMTSLFSAKMDMTWMTGPLRAEYVAAWRDASGVRGMVNWYRATPLQVALPGQPISSEHLPHWPPEAMRITMPHLVLWGLRDTALTAQSRVGLADFCDDLEVQETAEADHWILHQQPDFMAGHIRAFLKRKAGLDG